MVDPLAPLLADGVIDEVLGRLKSGKEAELWLVRHAGEVFAAKVYKDRQARSFRNNAAYKEGRQVRDSRTRRAMDRGSRFGQAASEEAWKAREADALHALHAAGIRVPRPVTFHEGVLLMEVVVDAHGRPAPRLVDAQLRREQAAALYADLRAQAIGMLACDLIHGDLSAYNVLLGRDGPVVIDFPQVVGAAHNGQAEAFFERDLGNVRRFLAQHDPALHASAGDAREIWRAYVRRTLTPDFVPTGRGAGSDGPRHRGGERLRQGPGGSGRGGDRRLVGEGPPRREDGRHRPQGGARSADGRRPTDGSARGAGRRRHATPMPEVVRVGWHPARDPAGEPGRKPAGGPHGAGHGAAHPPATPFAASDGLPPRRRRRRGRRGSRGGGGS